MSDDKQTPTKTSTLGRPVTAKTESSPFKTGDTVCVALKHPGGVILRAFHMERVNQTAPQGTIEVEEAKPYPQQFVVQGNANALILQRMGGMADQGGYALTEGCPRELWDKWYEDNKYGDLVQNELIFARASRPEALAHAISLGFSNRSGLEPLDPNNLELHLGRADTTDKRMRGGTVTAVATAD